MSIFQTKAWEGNWWLHWGATPGFSRIQETEKNLSTSNDRLYIDSYKIKRLFSIRCLQLVGSNYRRISTPRSEYGNIFDEDQCVEMYMVELDSIQSLRWTEAVFSDVLCSSNFSHSLAKWAKSNRFYIRKVYDDEAYGIATDGFFSDYLESLGKNTRLKLFNRRKLLKSLGNVCIYNAWPQDVDLFFDKLNEFHSVRWGKDCFSRKSIAFHKGFLKDIAAEDGGPDLSCIYFDNTIVSVLYNVKYNGVVYNFQAGFREDFHKKIALGTLHLGFSIEAAFHDSEVKYFDLLAGKGKNSNYKSTIASVKQGMMSVMIVRSPFFKLIYRLKDRFLT